MNKVCQFLAAPLESQWHAVKRILRYLSVTSHLGLLLQPRSPFASTTILIGQTILMIVDLPLVLACTLGSNMISWSSRKQTLVACSSAKAEYRGLANETTELMWVQSLLAELHASFPTPTLLGDNLSTVMIVHSPIFHCRQGEGSGP